AGRLISDTTVEVPKRAWTRILWRATSRRFRNRVAQSRGDRLISGQRRRTDARVLGRITEVEVQRVPPTREEKVEIEFLIAGRLAINIDVMGGSGSLVVLTCKLALILNHTIRSGLTGWAKLTFKHPVVTMISAEAQIRLAWHL